MLVSTSSQLLQMLPWTIGVPFVIYGWWCKWMNRCSGKNILVSEKDFLFSLFLVPIIFQQKILNEILISDFFMQSLMFLASLYSLVFTKHKLSIEVLSRSRGQNVSGNTFSGTNGDLMTLLPIHDSTIQYFYTTILLRIKMKSNWSHQ